MLYFLVDITCADYGGFAAVKISEVIPGAQKGFFVIKTMAENISSSKSVKHPIKFFRNK
jgi:hypothetical protein